MFLDAVRLCFGPGSPVKGFVLTGSFFVPQLISFFEPFFDAFVAGLRGVFGMDLVAVAVALEEDLVGLDVDVDPSVSGSVGAASVADGDAGAKFRGVFSMDLVAVALEEDLVGLDVDVEPSNSGSVGAGTFFAKLRGVFRLGGQRSLTSRGCEKKF